MAETSILVTGASGLLGRSIMEALSPHFKVTGLCYTRTSHDLVKLNLLDESAVTEYITTNRPTIIIHCAAERRPDVVSKDEALAYKLNVTVSGHIASLAQKIGSWFLYISTDYVFNGKNPPYNEYDLPDPLNAYGKTKLDGEKECMKMNPNSAILRIPLLYGRTEYNSESACNILIDIVNDTAKHYVMDHFQSSAEEKMTKYEICKVIAEELGKSMDHIEPLKVPDKSSLAGRPNDAHLAMKRMKELGIEYECKPFKDQMKSILNAIK